MAESTTKQSSVHSEAEFVLKHRIAGAAFLLFFGALFVPWLLGAPNSQPSASTNLDSENSTQLGLQNVDQDLVSALADEDIAGEEQVYISKITPLDANRNKSSDSESSVSDKQLDAKNLDSLDDDNEVATKSESEKPSQRRASANVDDDKIVEVKKPSESLVASKASVQNKPNVVTSTPKPKIDVGWMVQVGVFTDKRGANRVVEDLRGKGFAPSTSIVDTNRGKNTGTRIWLGPFAQRVDAAKAKNYLTEKTGEAGFIRAYP